MTKSIRQLTLYNFRNHRYFNIKAEAPLIILYGSNGVGKTNILESLSLLSPGRGLNSASISDMIQKGAEGANIYIQLEEDSINISLAQNKKSFQINQKSVVVSKQLLEIARILWLTPAMHSLFTAPRELRRNFFDRLIFSFEVKHAVNIIKYEYAKKERGKLLQKNGDNLWILELEDIMATYSVSIINTRQKVIKLLQDQINDNQHNTFPKPVIYLSGTLEELITNIKPEEAKLYLKEQFLKNRSVDYKLKRTTFGPHCTDFKALYPSKKITAEFCSTGEQKSLVISILLAAVQPSTILLLDDVTSNLDSNNLNYLLENLIAKGCQTWLSDTKPQPFNTLNAYQQLIYLG